MIPAVVIRPFAANGQTYRPAEDPEKAEVVHIPASDWMENAAHIRTPEEHRAWLAETAEERAAERARAAEEAEATRLAAERLAAEEAARQAAEAEEQRQREEEAERARTALLAGLIEATVLENVMTGGVGPYDEHGPIRKGTRVHLRPQIFLRLARRGFVKAARDHEERFAEAERAERAETIENLRAQIVGGGREAPNARRALEALAAAHPEVRPVLESLDSAEQAARDTLKTYVEGAA